MRDITYVTNYPIYHGDDLYEYEKHYSDLEDYCRNLYDTNILTLTEEEKKLIKSEKGLDYRENSIRTGVYLYDEYVVIYNEQFGGPPVNEVDNINKEYVIFDGEDFMLEERLNDYLYELNNNDSDEREKIRVLTQICVLDRYNKLLLKEN